MKSSYGDLLGARDFEKKDEQNATNRLYFLGILDILKELIRFTVIIRNRISLQNLQDTIIVYTNGNRTFIDLDNRLFIYNVSYEGTENMNDNLVIESNNDYRFSDEQSDFSSSHVAKINIIDDNIHFQKMFQN